MNNRELMMDDPQFVSQFIKLIDARIELNNKKLKFDFSRSATVISIGTGVADIKLQDATNTITGVKNKTGEMLVVGDEVVVEAINGSLNNLVIKYKK